MRWILKHLGELMARLSRRKPPHSGLSAVEYEAVCLIAYEGRAAFHQACEQALYCRAMGSPSGVIFWEEVAAEVARRTGRADMAKAVPPQD